MEIREIQKQDMEKIADVMAEAFAQDPLYRFFIEEELVREKFLKKFMMFRLRYGMKKGKVFVSEDCKSVAIWILPDREMTPGDLVFQGGLAAMLCCGKEERKRIMDFNAFADQQAACCIRRPFWHLSPICVAPAFQGQGYGKALLTHGLSWVDADHLPCYLETQCAKNVKIYEACGFHTMLEANIPGAEQIHYAMVRNAAAGI